ncbi:MAG: epoxyqueuosine reductase QueH [bacterium]|nr:epoxyqueuosine reductase QueH [bacterium]
MSKPRLLLHICCGVCGVYVLEKLKQDFEVTAYFYNPNIYPPEEYNQRLEAVRKICQNPPQSPFLKGGGEGDLIEGKYEPEKWLAYLERESKSPCGPPFAKGELGGFDFRQEPEGGRRCALCFEQRLNEAGKYAKENGFEFFATTLTMGRNKKAAVINAIGQGIAAKYGLRFYEADWKKQDGALKADRLSKEKGIYHQHYCGCEFSQR